MPKMPPLPSRRYKNGTKTFGFVGTQLAGTRKCFQTSIAYPIRTAENMDASESLARLVSGWPVIQEFLKSIHTADFPLLVGTRRKQMRLGFR